MKINILSFIFSGIIFFSGCNQETEVRFSTATFTLDIDNNGNVIKMADKKTGKDYLAHNQPAPLMSVKIGGKMIPPSSMKADNDGLLLYYNHNNKVIKAKIKIIAKNSHLAFELIDIEQDSLVELIVWGPYPTVINKIIGETVGVVRDDEYAIGLQALNTKTLGGYPWKDNDCMPQLDIFESGDYSDLSEKGKRYVLYRVEAAKPAVFGSTLQAYCRNRFKPRIIKNMGYDKFISPAYDDGGVTGSAIALFGCPVEKTLDYIEQIELSEGLPHPLIDGVWSKKAPAANASYLIMEFGEKNITKALEYTKKAGLRYLYHPGPFSTWGHFKLNKDFPGGLKSLKHCVEIAEKQNIHLGVHTLSNFITTNDKYVTPVPDKRLAEAGSSKLVNDIDRSQTEIPIDSPGVFKSLKRSNLKTVMIDEELIRTGGLSGEKPWRLLNCRRGMYNTKKAHHKAGTEISLLADHGYKVFLTNADLTKEAGENIAEIFNETGLRQISFDGLEGCQSTGMGNYGEILLTDTWYNNLSENIKNHYIADASRTSHFFWHIFTRMNWGEPWYAGFRESQTEYRFKNQKYFSRNFIPGMLGWFRINDKTTPEDIEWMLAKAAGYNAGFGLVCDFKSLKNNYKTNEMLNLVNLWETARLSNDFNSQIKKELRDTKKEFHLEANDPNGLLLTAFNIYRLEYSRKERQPGEPGLSSLTFANPQTEQQLQFIIYAEQGRMNNIIIVVDENKEIEIPVSLHSGDRILYNGGEIARILDKNNKETGQISINAVSLKKGEHTVTLTCSFQDSDEGKIKLEIRVPEGTINIKN